LSCIGEALLGLNRSADAIEPLRKSVELRMPNASYELGWSRFLLARALLLSGQQAAGKQEMKEAIQVFSEYPPVDPHMATSVDNWRRQESD
jgi:predicted Zn-dependent protease